MGDPYLVTATFNLHRTSTPKQAEADLYRLLRPRGELGRPVIVGLNEAANHVGVIHAVARALNYSVVVADGDRAARNNVLLVARWAADVIREPDPRLQAEATDGTPERWQVAARVLFRPASQTIAARVDHANSHVERRSWWRLPRLKEYRAHMARLGAQARRTSAPTIWFGDLNVSYRSRVARAVRFFPVRTFRRGGAYTSYQALGMPELGTHGRRLIDYIILKGRGVVRFVSQVVEDGYHSDHRPLIVVFKVTRAR